MSVPWACRYSAAAQALLDGGADPWSLNHAGGHMGRWCSGKGVLSRWQAGSEIVPCAPPGLTCRVLGQTLALLLPILTAGKSAITLAADRGNTRLQQLFVKAVPCPRECALRHSGWLLCSCVRGHFEEHPRCCIGCCTECHTSSLSAVAVPACCPVQVRRTSSEASPPPLRRPSRRLLHPLQLLRLLRPRRLPQAQGRRPPGQPRRQRQPSQRQQPSPQGQPSRLCSAR